MRDVYPPSEDTDLLLRALPAPFGAGRALEVGSGSGVVARALAEKGWRVVAVDINPAAVEATRALGIDAARGHLAAAMRGPFDLVVFNAPYLPSEPHERVEGWLDRAFHGGDGGVEVSEAFARDLPRILAAGGHALLVGSSRSDLARLARSLKDVGVRYEQVAAARFFFEEIAVWRLAA